MVEITPLGDRDVSGFGFAIRAPRRGGVAVCKPDESDAQFSGNVGDAVPIWVVGASTVLPEAVKEDPGEVRPAALFVGLVHRLNAEPRRRFDLEGVHSLRLVRPCLAPGVTTENQIGIEPSLAGTMSRHGGVGEGAVPEVPISAPILRDHSLHVEVQPDAARATPPFSSPIPQRLPTSQDCDGAALVGEGSEDHSLKLRLVPTQLRPKLPFRCLLVWPALERTTERIDVVASVSGPAGSAPSGGGV